jgi:F-type H+-transporting ATPase subunit b
MFVTEALAEDAKPAAEAGADAHGAAVEGAAPAAGAAHTESTAGHEGGHGGVFPPFDSSTYASQILWLAITFGLFYLFLKRVILPRVGGILSDREGRIASDLKAAEKMKAEADASVAAYEQELASAKAKAADIAGKAGAASKAESEAKRKAAEADLDKKTSAAEAKIAAIKASGMKEVGRIAEDTVSEIIRQFTGASVSAADVAAAVKSVKG